MAYVEGDEGLRETRLPSGCEGPMCSVLWDRKKKIEGLYVSTKAYMSVRRLMCQCKGSKARAVLAQRPCDKLMASSLIHSFLPFPPLFALGTACFSKVTDAAVSS